MRQIIEVEHEPVSRIARQFVFLLQIYALAREHRLAEEKITMLHQACVRQGNLLRRTLKRHLTEFGLVSPQTEVNVWCEGLEITLQSDEHGSLSISRITLPSSSLDDLWHGN